MNILCIGNCFSADATRYLHDIAKADGTALEVANLYIGGCPLDRHYRNMLSGAKDYQLQYNGHMTGFFVSMDDALLNRKWDIVTLQQVSTDSGMYKSYFPYLADLNAQIKDIVPEVQIWLHETWAYEADSDKLRITAGYETPEQMLADIRSAYSAITEELHADGLIPSGELMGKLLENGIQKVHRDTYHASFGLGRYALGLLWYHVLTGRSVADNTFCSFDLPISEEEQKIAKLCAESFSPLF